MSKPSKRDSSLYRKTLSAILAVGTLLIVAGGLIGSRALERLAVDQLRQTLLTTARLMEPDILPVFLTSPTTYSIQPLVSELAERGNCRVTVIDRSGQVLGDSEKTVDAVPRMENHGDRPEIQAALAGQVGTSLRHSQTMEHPMLYLALPLSNKERVSGVLRVAVPLTAIAELRREIRLIVLGSLLIALILSVVLGAWLAGRLTRPLARLTQVAETYAKGNFAAEPPASSIRELRVLSESLTSMAKAISTTIDTLKTERNQATAILESMAEGVIAVDSRGSVILVNPAATTLLNLDTKQAPGRTLFELIRMPEMQRIARVVLQDHRYVIQEMRVFRPQERVLRVHAAPCEASGPAEPCAVLVIQDVTERHRFDQLRREFVANVTHELKSPLTSIHGLAETLLSGAVDDRANNRRFVQLIEEDATRLARLIDDLLSLSQLEAQPAPLKLSRVELKPLVESVIALLNPGVKQRRLRVVCDLPGDLAVQADVERLRQVVSNLLDNAIKYNRDEGEILISATREDGWVKVTVADTGIGIPAKDLPRIFERFYRVDKARSRELGGTGLGLSIVKHIVEAHGGQVSVASQLDQGSIFSFTVPLAP